MRAEQPMQNSRQTYLLGELANDLEINNRVQLVLFRKWLELSGKGERELVDEMPSLGASVAQFAKANPTKEVDLGDERALELLCREIFRLDMKAAA